MASSSATGKHSVVSGKRNFHWLWILYVGKICPNATIHVDGTYCKSTKFRVRFNFADFGKFAKLKYANCIVELAL